MVDTNQYKTDIILYGEYIDYMRAYRLYTPDNPCNTVAFISPEDLKQNVSRETTIIR